MEKTKPSKPKVAMVVPTNGPNLRLESPENRKEFVKGLQPILAELDAQNGQQGPCPGCGGRRWKTVKRNEEWACRMCEYERRVS